MPCLIHTLIGAASLCVVPVAVVFFIVAMGGG